MSMAKKIKLVLSGSGSLYPVHAGAIMCLVQNGYEIEAVCGVSGGAIIAAILASGFKPNIELVRLIKQTLPGKNNLINYSLWSLATKWGLIDGTKIEKMLEKHFVKTLGDVTIPLIIATTNVNYGRSQFFSSDRLADKKISLARVVHASMAIPLIFCPVKIGTDIHVDGGWVNDFPIDIFGENSNTVGLCFLSENPGRKLISDFKSFIVTLIGTSIEENVREDIEDNSVGSMINLTSRYTSLNFNISTYDVQVMIQEGFDCVKKAIKAGKLDGITG